MFDRDGSAAATTGRNSELDRKWVVEVLGRGVDTVADEIVPVIIRPRLKPCLLKRQVMASPIRQHGQVADLKSWQRLGWVLVGSQAWSGGQ